MRSVPLRRLSQKATATALGAGSRRADSSAAPRRDLPDDDEARSAAPRSASDPERRRGRRSEAAIGTAMVRRPRAAGRISLAMVSPNGPVLTASVGALRRVRQRQQREDQLGEAVGFLEMRVAGQDEGVDADRPVLLHPRRDFLGRADQRRSGAAAHQADAGPEVGADHELVAPAAMQRAHPALADRVHAREDRLRLGDRLVVEMAISRSAAAQASSDVSRTMTCRRMPKLSLRPRLRAAALDLGDLLGDQRRRLAPGQVLVDRLGGDVDRLRPTSRRNRAADAAPAPAERAAGRLRCGCACREVLTVSPASSAL